MFAFGIEHEVALLDRNGDFVDWTTTTFAELEAVVANLPLYETDYPQLRVGDAGIKRKRWYIEGFERYDAFGQSTICLPKGIEIRTTIHPTILGAVDELTRSFHLLAHEARAHGFTPALTSFHPYLTAFTPGPPLNAYEQQRRLQSPEKRTAFLPMLTHGPDLNLSLHGLSPSELIDLGRKLTYYSSYIIPFSFSSPFSAGALWEGLSVRTWRRTGARPAALVFVAQPTELIASDPSLTKLARIPREAGRIEFKACDSCADFTLYAALLALLKGVVLDTTLEGRATVPDVALHQLSARQGWTHDAILTGTRLVLQAAEQALRTDSTSAPDVSLLAPLWTMLEQQTTPAHALVQAFRNTGSIEMALRSMYTLHES
ncbi:MAG: glutamate--cysteine ligase [Ktedonobacteraceae bacterium]|nr:glutamate--cysteine ligase [Ktedonobacteraceae bacterium]